VATSTPSLVIGPADHGRRMSLRKFIAAEFREGWFYELGRGKVVVTDVPGVNHGRVVMRVGELFALYNAAHPGVINYRAGGQECRLRMPGLRSDRHPDQAVYLLPPPEGDDQPWSQWVPQVVVEVLSKGGRRRDLVEKREEYLRMGVSEYWILDPKRRDLRVLRRDGDVWAETLIPSGGVHRPHLLPGLDVRPDDLFGPPAG